MEEVIDSGSSEDEACSEAFKESIDPAFFQQCFPRENVDTSQAKNEIKNHDGLDLPQGLSDTFKDFVAKKLTAKLSMNNVIKYESPMELKLKENSNESAGIKLFSASSTITLGVNEFEQSPKNAVKKLKMKNEKLIFEQCAEVTIQPEVIISQNELKYWTNRKPSKIYHYRKKSNTLTQYDPITNEV